MVNIAATTEKQDPSTGAAAKAVGCRHHWMIDPAQSRTSHGVCLLCRARREFPNYLSDCLIDNDMEKFEQWLAREGRRRAGKSAGSPHEN